MIEPWNDSSLLPPPVHTFPSNRKVDIQELRSIFKNIIKVLSNQSPLHKESAILSRFAYKFDKKFRNDIGYRHYKKVNVALRRYLGLNILKDMENFSSTLPSAHDEVYLPTKQMLQCGESHWMSLMPYAVLSRVWSLCGLLLRHACSWYLRLHPWLTKLLVKGVEFLPNNYNLPTDLEEWLDLKHIDTFGRFEWAPNKCLMLHQTLIVDEDNENSDSLVDYVKRLNEAEDFEELPVSCNYKTNNLPEAGPPAVQINQILNADQGEIISRESFTATLSTPELKPTALKNKHKYNHSPANVTDTESLQEFMSNEESYRNEQSSMSLTSHLSFMQWYALKNSLDMLTNSLSNKRKIEKKFKKIWKEKCIDYS